jgi:predicted ABC-type ATPase
VDRPQLWVVAGPNGVGKSTLVERFRIANRIPVVNPDAIALELDPGHAGKPAVMLRAGKIAAARRRTLLRAGESFAIETTLTGHSEHRLMRTARQAAYKINIVFVCVDDALTALARVRERVMRGGHDVPADIVLQRYAKSLANLSSAIALADRCFIIDNTQDRHRLLLTIEEGHVRRVSLQLPDWVRASVPSR